MIVDPHYENIQKACALLKKGQVVVMPTETVYGLAADATNDKAIEQIYQIKNRPSFNPLIIHVKDWQQAKNYVEKNEWAEILTNHFWPGPLTLVLKRKASANLSSLATAKLDTVAIRSPCHPVAYELLKQFGKPLAAPSANLSTEISPTSSKEVYLGSHDLFILEGGQCQIGLESTIIDLSGDLPTLLRPGGISLEILEQYIGPVQKGLVSKAIKAPGMLKRHYAPKKSLRLNVLTNQEDEGLLGFGLTDLKVEMNLSPKGDLCEAARNLFHMLRLLDRSPFPKLAVMPIPHEGLGRAINDRLQRAASNEH